MTVTFEINMVSLAWVIMFVVDDIVKTKRFFVQQRKSYRSSRSNREFFTIFIEREICTSPFFK